MVFKTPKIRQNPQNINDYADIFPSEWYARYAWYARNYAPLRFEMYARIVQFLEMSQDQDFTFW